MILILLHVIANFGSLERISYLQFTKFNFSYLIFDLKKIDIFLIFFNQNFYKFYIKLIIFIYKY